MTHINRYLTTTIVMDDFEHIEISETEQGIFLAVKIESADEVSIKLDATAIRAICDHLEECLTVKAK